MKINFKSLLNNELVQGMIIPLAFYWVGGRFFSGFTLCMVTLVYSVSFIVFKAIQDKKLNVFGVITLLMSFVSIIGMLYFPIRKLCTIQRNFQQFGHGTCLFRQFVW